MGAGASLIYLEGKKPSLRCTSRRLESLGYMTKRDPKCTMILPITENPKAWQHTGTTMRHESQLFEQTSRCRIKSYSNWEWMPERIVNQRRAVSSCCKCISNWMQHKLQRNTRRMCRGANRERLRSNRIRKLELQQRREALSRVSREHQRVVSWRRRSGRLQYWQRSWSVMKALKGMSLSDCYLRKS